MNAMKHDLPDLAVTNDVSPREFVEEFGTHYPQEVEMGSSLHAVTIVTKEEMRRHSK